MSAHCSPHATRQARRISLATLLTLAAPLAATLHGREAAGSPVDPASAIERYLLISNGEKIGTLTATTSGRRVEIDWRADDNGRGSKLRERVELGPDGVPVLWSIKGVGWIGAPVEESFTVQGQRASWRSLDDAGSAETTGARVYVPTDSSPWSTGLFLRLLAASPHGRLAVLPGGELRAEKLRQVRLGEGPQAPTATAYALWGLDSTPIIALLGTGGTFHGFMTGWSTFVEERLGPQSASLSRLGQELSAEYLGRLGKTLAHNFEGPIYLSNVRVFDSLAGVLGAPTNVVVFGDRIVGVHSAPPPAGATVIDGEGGALLPGLHDMHAHLSDWEAALHIAAGVTTARDAGNDNPVLLALARKIRGGEVIGPRLHRSGFIEGKSSFSAHVGFVVDRLEAALDKVRWYADHGFTRIKLYNSITPSWIRPIAAEAHRLGLGVHGHVPAFTTAWQAVLDGYDEVTHINQLMLSFVINQDEDTRTPFRFTALGERVGKLDLRSAKVQRMVRLMKKRRTAIDPTLAVFESMLLARRGQVGPTDIAWLSHMPMAVQRARRTLLLDVKPSQMADYEASAKRLGEMIRLLEGEGIQILPGTDDVAGFVLHSELEAYARAGLAPARILQMATIDCARYLGEDRQSGSVAQGKLADLLLVAGDPTREIGAIRRARMVMKGGTVYYPEEIYRAMGIEPFAPRPQVAHLPPSGIVP